MQKIHLPQIVLNLSILICVITTSSNINNNHKIWAAESLKHNLVPGQQQQQQQQPTQMPPQPPPPLLLLPQCTLGNFSYQLGERWNPNLPPFGVQVCVLCECSIRQRKSCFETRVTCRRIANECPIIDSCPDGKRPVTIAGQCCKSCQNNDGDGSEKQSQEVSTSSSSINSTLQPPPLPVPQAIDSGGSSKLNQLGGGDTPNLHNNQQQKSAPITTEETRAFYKNERIKEYQSIIKNLSPCAMPRRGDRNGGGSGADGKQQASSGKGANKQGALNKMNDLNGIDSRLAFKSLHDTHEGNYLQPKNRNTGGESSTNGAAAAAADDSLKHDHQHPNDVSGNQQSSLNVPPNRSQYASSSSSTARPQELSSSTCILGDELFQVGDKWNPNLPSFGVQICVQCECVVRQRNKSCFEAKVTCRRISNECPTIETCPNGKKPVTIVGQCCKSCQQHNINNTNNQQQEHLTTTTTTAASTGVILMLERTFVTQVDEKILKEYKSIMEALPACSAKRQQDGSSNNGNGSGSGSSSSSSGKQ